MTSNCREIAEILTQTCCCETTRSWLPFCLYSKGVRCPYYFAAVKLAGHQRWSVLLKRDLPTDTYISQVIQRLLCEVSLWASLRWTEVILHSVLSKKTLSAAETDILPVLTHILGWSRGADGKQTQRASQSWAKQCALFTVYCALSTVQCALFTVNCSLYIVYCAVCNVNCALLTEYCVFYTVHCLAQSWAEQPAAPPDMSRLFSTTAWWILAS